MKKLYFLMAIIPVLSGGVNAQYQLVCIGSSTTAGTGAKPVDSSWVNRIDQYYGKELKLLDSTYTLAVPGYPCYKGMPDNYVPAYGRDLPDYNRNVSKALRLLDGLVMPSRGVVIINFPSNGYVTYSIEEVLYCLQSMYDSVVREGHRCYVTTTQVRTDGDFGKSATKRKMAILKDSILQRFGVHAINFYDGTYNPADTTILPQYASGDGIHLNNRGYRELFERVRAKQIFGDKPDMEIQQYSATLKDGVQQVC